LISAFACGATTSARTYVHVHVAVALVDCSGGSHSMNPSPASPYGGSTVKVDVDPVRVIVLMRVTSEKLTRRDHVETSLCSMFNT